ncbi:MAG TPA: hypothetical protein VH988_01165 [Thermoanaerobaculia bacterium]|nr:hypothetical protein [Thermoanaerobaculia bacterium]
MRRRPLLKSPHALLSGLLLLSLCGGGPAVASPPPGPFAGVAGDLIAVDGDPLRDVSELERVKVVVLGGRAVRRD